MNKNFYRAFEERYRGSRETIKGRLQIYRPFLEALNTVYPQAHVLDIGCGRGEWLELLQETGFSPLGIDLDEGMLAACIERGLPAQKGDALDYLKALAPNSQAVISAFHVVEHISFGQLQALIADAHNALVPGGLLILETPNPENLNVGAHTFHLDPTHTKPIPPNLLLFACEFNNFQRVKIMRLQSPVGLDQNDNPTLLQILTEVSPDYSVLSQKAGPDSITTPFDSLLNLNYGVDFATLVARFDNQLLAHGTELTVQHSEAQSQRTKLVNLGTELEVQRTEAQSQRTELLNLGAELSAQRLDWQAQRTEQMAHGTELAVQRNNVQSQFTELSAQQIQLQSQRLNLAEYSSELTNLRRELLLLRRRVIGKTYANLRVPWHTHIYRAARCIYEKNEKPWHTHVFRAWRCLAGDRRYKPRLLARTCSAPLQMCSATNQKLSESNHEVLARTAFVSTKPLEGRPALAFFSPLPPEASGIAAYSATLLESLSQHYDIHIITRDQQGDFLLGATVLPTRSLSHFRANPEAYQRVLYQVGNSPFHDFILGALANYPGVVVLHDFFLGNAYEHLEHVQMQGRNAENSAPKFLPQEWVDELYAAHGYTAAMQRYETSHSALGTRRLCETYPCSLRVIQNSVGVIVHSDHVRELSQMWYGKRFAANFRVVPLLRQATQKLDKASARASLWLDVDSIIVSTFGVVDENKWIECLLRAAAQLSSTTRERLKLVIVGPLTNPEYYERLRRISRDQGLDASLIFTDRVSDSTYQQWLAATDVAVQLRKSSRGESSAAVLDCLIHSLPTIINPEGTFADLSEDIVRSVTQPDRPETLALVIESLLGAAAEARALGERARHRIISQHSPESCALAYREALECFYKNSRPLSIRQSRSQQGGAGVAFYTAQEKPGADYRTLFLDVSITCKDDYRTGIQRVVRAITTQLIHIAPIGLRIEPIYQTDEGGYWHYNYARNWTFGLFGSPPARLKDELVAFSPDDIYLLLDFTGGMVTEANRYGLLKQLKTAGVLIGAVVYDLLPINYPHFFPEHMAPAFRDWLKAVVAHADFITCISQTVRDNLAKCIPDYLPDDAPAPSLHYFHLGSDITDTVPTRGIPDVSSILLASLIQTPSFLMVGTIEPRKGHSDILAAFECLWANQVKINLVIVGKEGWMMQDLISQIQSHPQNGARLHYLQNVSDEFLDHLYDHCICLIAASYDEGFGLPIIEAAKKNTPIIARDIPVFREVAGRHASYFSPGSPDQIARHIVDWLSAFNSNQHPSPAGARWTTWRESAEQLLTALPIRRGQLAVS